MNSRTMLSMAFAAVAVIGGFALGYILFRSPPPPAPAPQARVSAEQPAPAPPPSFAPAPDPNPDWRTYHGPAAFTGAVDAPLPDQLGLLWRFKAGAPVRQTPVICGGLVYFATARGQIFAVNQDGERVWSRQLFSEEEGSEGPLRAQIEAPVACFGGLVIVATMDGAVHVLDALSGVENWHVQLDSPVMGSPNYLHTEAGGRIFIVGRGEGVLYCLDSENGNVLWRGQPIDRCDGSPAVSEKAIAYGSCAAALHVLSPQTGELLRNIELGVDSQVAAGVAIDGDWIISGSRSGAVVKVNAATGETAWTSKDIEAEVFTTPAVTQQWVVVAANDGFIYEFDRASGKLVWKFDAGGMPASPVIAGNKVVAAAGGSLIMLALEDGRKLWDFKVSDEITGPAVAMGRVFIGSEDGTVAAFGVADFSEPA